MHASAKLYKEKLQLNSTIFACKYFCGGFSLILGVKHRKQHVHWLGCNLAEFVAYCNIKLQHSPLGQTIDKIPRLLGVYHLNSSLNAVASKFRFKAILA